MPAALISGGDSKQGLSALAEGRRGFIATPIVAVQRVDRGSHHWNVAAPTRVGVMGAVIPGSRLVDAATASSNGTNQRRPPARIVARQIPHLLSSFSATCPISHVLDQVSQECQPVDQ